MNTNEESSRPGTPGRETGKPVPAPAAEGGQKKNGGRKRSRGDAGGKAADEAAEPERTGAKRSETATGKSGEKPAGKAGAKPGAKKRSGAQNSGTRAGAKKSAAQTDGQAKRQEKAARQPGAPEKPETAGYAALAERAEPAERATLAGAAIPAGEPIAPPAAPAKPEKPEQAEKAGRQEQAGKPDRPAQGTKTPPPPSGAGHAAEKPAGGQADAGKALPQTDASVPPLPRVDEDGEPLTPEEQARVETISQTARLSIEKILEGAAIRSGANTEECNLSEPPVPPQESEPPEPEETLPEKIGQAVVGGLGRVAKWLLLVAVFILVIAGSGVAWLYKNTTPGAVPVITVYFAGSELQPTAYRWHVPVVGSLIRRTYEQSTPENAAALEEALDTNAPILSVAPDGYATKLTITDSEKNKVFAGTAEEYKDFSFGANGTYQAKLVVKNSEGTQADNALVTGSQTYQFSFTIGVKPIVRINTNAIQQGSVVAVRVSGDSKDAQEQPTLHCDFADTTFVTSASGWVAFLPVASDQEVGDYQITVKAGSYTEVLPLAVKARTWVFKDYGSKSQLSKPHIGVEDTPAEVQRVLEICDPQVYWTASSFVQPFLTNIKIQMDYGTVEYVGRTTAQKSKNVNVNGRVSTNVVLTCTPNQDLIAPADGRILLAADLGVTAGNTVVVEHGAGVKSIFYGLKSLGVSEGQIVMQGQALGKTSATMIGEVRIGSKPVDPMAVWRGQCDALRFL